MNSKSRVYNSARSISMNLLLQLTNLVLGLVTRSIFIYVLGVQYLGISGLFSSILSILSLSELGIGATINFYLYKPAAENNYDRFIAFMSFYKTCYRFIGLAITVIGICAIPILPYLVNFETELPVNLYLIYILTLLNCSISYFLFAYIASSFDAFQETYKLAFIKIIYQIVNSSAIIVVLICAKNYYLYLTAQLFLNATLNLIIGYCAYKNYPFLKQKVKKFLKANEIRSIFKNVYAVFIFKIGNVLIISTDNILISIFCGTIIVGYYSNYTLIMGYVTTLYNAIMVALLPSIGNLCSTESIERQEKVFGDLHFLNMLICNFCALCLMVLLNPTIYVWTQTITNENYILNDSVPFFIGINFWMIWYLQIIGHFRTAKGLFQYGKYSQLLVGIGNLILSILLANLYGIEGILVATAICAFFIGFVPFSHYTFKYGFNKSAKGIVFLALRDFVILIAEYFLIKSACLWMRQYSILNIFIIFIICSLTHFTLMLLIFNKSRHYLYIKKTLYAYLKKQYIANSNL